MSKEAVLDAWFAAFNAHDIGALIEIADPSIEIVPLAGATTAPPGTTYHGHAGLRSLIQPGYDRWPSLRIERGVTREENGRFVVEVLFVYGDGRPSEREAVCVYEVRADHITRVETYERGAIPPRRQGDLTAREREVLMLLAEGHTVDEVATQLVISPLTVRTHVRNAKDKLAARTTAHAVAMTVRSADGRV